MSIFGPRIIGKAKFDAQKKAEKTGANIYGPKVTSQKAAPAPKADRPSAEQRRLAAMEAEIVRLRADLAAARVDDGAASDEGEAQPPEALAVLEDAGPEEDPEGAPEPVQAPVPEEDAEQKEAGQLTQAEVADALQKNPIFLDRLIDQEFRRRSGPRKGVARILLEHERKREGGARSEKVAQLEAVIGA